MVVSARPQEVVAVADYGFLGSVRCPDRAIADISPGSIYLHPVLDVTDDRPSNAGFPIPTISWPDFLRLNQTSGPGSARRHESTRGS